MLMRKIIYCRKGILQAIVRYIEEKNANNCKGLIANIKLI